MKTIEILGIALLAIYGIITAAKWSELSNVGKGSVIFAVVIAILIAYNAFKAESDADIQRRVEAKVGEIQDNSLTHVQRIEIGDSGTFFTLGGNGTFFTSALRTKPMLQVNNNKGKIEVYAVVRDFNGKVVAVIDKNHWKVFSEEYEYNNDKNTFELVTAGERQLFFQISVNTGVVKLMGAILDPAGNGMFFCEGENGALMSPVRKEYFDPRPFPCSDKLIFKYPREKFLGVKSN